MVNSHLDRRQGREVWVALLLPWAAVGIGWTVLENAWVALGAYHVGILALARGRLGARFRQLFRGSAPRRTVVVLLFVPPAAWGFVAALPRLLHPGMDPRAWLADHGLSGLGLFVLVGVYGLIHPCLEEVHFQWLRGVAPRRAHFGYAGYHGLVLAGCFAPWAVVATVSFLVVVSSAFGVFERGPGGPRLSFLLHLAGDLAVAAVVLRWGGFD